MNNSHLHFGDAHEVYEVYVALLAISPKLLKNYGIIIVIAYIVWNSQGKNKLGYKTIIWSYNNMGNHNSSFTL